MKGALARLLLASVVAISAPSSAQALCIYNGVDNVKTTLAQEFRDARWVVRAHVVSADYHWSDEDDSWVLYRLKVVESFKGDLSPRFTFFTERNSGGFYMDGGTSSPDMDGDFLLFLVEQPFPATLPTIAKGALWVNYNCGQSKSWGALSRAELAELRSLAAGR